MVRAWLCPIIPDICRIGKPGPARRDGDVCRRTLGDTCLSTVRRTPLLKAVRTDLTGLPWQTDRVHVGSWRFGRMLIHEATRQDSASRQFILGIKTSYPPNSIFFISLPKSTYATRKFLIRYFGKHLIRSIKIALPKSPTTSDQYTFSETHIRNPA